MIHHGSPIRSSSKTSQGPPPRNLPTPPSPAKWDGQSWEHRVPRVGWASFRSCPNPTPGAGYVAQEGHSCSKYNLSWPLSWAWMRKEGICLVATLAELPVPASGCDPCWPSLGQGAWPRKSFPPSPLPPTGTRLLPPPTQDVMFCQGLRVSFSDLGSSPNSITVYPVSQPSFTQ